MREIFVFLDENNFCTGWTSSKEDNSYSIIVEDEDIINKIRYYKYENGTLIYDESNILLVAKETKRIKARNFIAVKLEKGFKIEILNSMYTYLYGDENKAYLNKVYELSTSGLIDNATFDLIDSNNKEVSMIVDRINITELWLLSFLHEENLKKELNQILIKIDEAETMEDLQKIILDKNE